MLTQILEEFDKKYKKMRVSFPEFPAANPSWEEDGIYHEFELPSGFRDFLKQSCFAYAKSVVGNNGGEKKAKKYSNDDDYCDSYLDGWNDCRSQILANIEKDRL